MDKQSNQQRQRHTPIRTCIACRQSDAKRQLIRLVRTSDGRVTVDLTGKQHGRGAYLCQQSACWQRALRQRSLHRALRLTHDLHPDDRIALEAFGQHLEAPMQE